ncbi:MAG: efflux RND transporter periplasmic adaptor subunit [Alphaproteobacteria bacterium]|nr:efflux RND transporter periplasmic adaptor subunit [Alphaproteobacteria bacterium]
MKSSYITAAAILVLSTGWVLSGSIEGPVVEKEHKIATETLTTVRVRNSAVELTVAEFITNGLTKADRKVEVKAETSGTIADLDAKEGTMVREGDVIASLDMDSRRTQYNQAKSLVRQMQIEFDAVNKLAEKGLTSNSRIAGATANLEQAKAALERIALDIKDVNVKAPFDGVLEKVHVEKGDFIDVGNSIATVIDMDPIKIEASVSERYVKSIIRISKVTRNGKPNKILEQIKGKARFVNGEEIDCRVAYISSSADPVTRTFRVELEADNPKHAIPEGLTVELRVPFDQVMAHKVSPALLALNDKGDIGIKVVDENDTVQFYTVNIIKHKPEAIWFGGLPKNIKLITVGQDFVKVGQKVISVDEALVAEKTKEIVSNDKQKINK